MNPDALEPGAKCRDSRREGVFLPFRASMYGLIVRNKYSTQNQTIPHTQIIITDYMKTHLEFDVDDDQAQLFSN